MKIINFYSLPLYVPQLTLCQSPVDIVTQAAVSVSPVTVPGLVSTGFEDDISGFLANTGRMLQFAVLGYARPTIEAGPLGDKKYSEHNLNH